MATERAEVARSINFVGEQVALPRRAMPMRHGESVHGDLGRSSIWSGSEACSNVHACYGQRKD